LSPEQIDTILSPKRVENGINSSLKSITENPYILAEEYVGNDPDDTIPWGRIDRGALPSPELGGSRLVDLDDPKRMRALAVQCLKREGKQTFLPASYLTQEINQRIAVLPDYKRHTFTDRYWEVDAEFLSEALYLRTNDGRVFVYQRSNYEDERLIESELKFLIASNLPSRSRRPSGPTTCSHQKVSSLKRPRSLTALPYRARSKPVSACLCGHSRFLPVRRERARPP
jgi:exodeoxyribonuclease V alpha subunit